jgi:hypothetical protein
MFNPNKPPQPASAPAEKSELFNRFKDKIESLQTTFEPGETIEVENSFKILWEHAVQPLENPEERATLEGIYDKKAEGYWRGMIDRSTSVARERPDLHIQATLKALETFPFASEETRAGLIAEARNKEEEIGLDKAA